MKPTKVRIAIMLLVALCLCLGQSNRTQDCLLASARLSDASVPEHTREQPFAALIHPLVGPGKSITRVQSKKISAAVSLASDTEVREILAERVKSIAAKEGGIGIVVGLIGPEGSRVISYGHSGRGVHRPLDGDTVFEIGSIGKVFTALILADLVRDGEVILTDPVTKYLRNGVRIPDRNGRMITILDLATHTSGLPFMPDEIPVFYEQGQRYSDQKLYDFLARYRLTRDPGADWDYSNIGYWLLAQALSFRSGKNFDDLLRTRVIEPLKLKSTALAITPKLKRRLAVGHNAILEPAPSAAAVSIYNAMPAAGAGFVSTVNDLLTFLRYVMGYQDSMLATTMSDMLLTRRPISRRSEQALGWVVRREGDNELIMHDGGSWGYNSYLAWDPKRRIGVVVLSNQLSNIGDIGRHLLRPDEPLEQPVVMQHKMITLKQTVLNKYAGRYESEDEGTFNVVKEGDFLTLGLPIGWGLPKFKLHAESSTDFFVSELPIRVSFRLDKEGRVAGLLVHPPRGQGVVSANRIE